MTTSTHLAQARSLLRIPAQRKVASLLEGEYVAMHPGRSTEFTDLREYVRGDDPKDLDWKASARARTLLVRRYSALRKLTVQLVVSTGRSMAAASSVDVPKRDVAVLVAGLVGHLAVSNGDLVGVVHGDAERQVVVPPRGSAQHVEHGLDAVHRATTPDAGPSDLAVLLRRFARSVRRRSLVVVVTDVVALDDDTVAALRRLQVQHEVLVAIVEGLDPVGVDPAEPRVSTDVDSGALVPGWMRGDAALATALADVVTHDRERLEAVLDRLGVAHVHVRGAETALADVRTLLERHRRAGRR